MTSHSQRRRGRRGVQTDTHTVATIVCGGVRFAAKGPGDVQFTASCRACEVEGGACIDGGLLRKGCDDLSSRCVCVCVCV